MAGEVIGEALLKVRADTTGVEGDLEKAGKKGGQQAADSFASSFRQRWGTMNFGTLLAGGGLVTGVTQVIGAASDLNETIAKSGEVFGDAMDDMEAWSAEASSAFGMSQRAALDAASSFGIFANAAGKTDAEAAYFSRTLTELATDLSSFYNTSTEDAAFAIGAALRGEAEPLRKYGVLLDDATLKAKALEMGIYSGTGTLTQQQKILAAYEVILAQTTVAQGDFERTQSGVANQTRIAKARFEDLKAALGTGLLPIAATALGVFNGLLQFFVDLDPASQKLASMILGVGTAALVLGRGLLFLTAQVLNVVAGFQKLAMFLSANPYVLIIAATIALAALIYFKWEEISTWVENALHRIGDSINWLYDGPLTDLGNWFGNWPDHVSGAAGAVVDALSWAWEQIRELAKKIGESLDHALGPLDEIVGGVAGLIGRGAGGLGGILGFDDGGTIPGPRGAPRLVLAHGGETVLPTHKQPMSDFTGGGGVNYNGPMVQITGPVSIRDDRDVTRLARELRREAETAARARGVRPAPAVAS